jgi:hypothetical protein
MTLIGVWLLVGQWALNYPFDVTGQNTALRDTGLAIVLTLAGLRLWWLARERDQHQDEGAHTTQVLVQMDEVRMNERSAGPHLTRPSRSAHRGAVALTVAVLAGIFLLSAGWIFPHVTPVDRWNEILAGALVLLAAAGARTGLRLPTSR